MELNEEKQLEKILNDFTAAMQIFSQKDFEKAFEAFKRIEEEYKDSDYYSVLEIQGRVKVYKNICHAQANPVNVELNSDEDYVNESLYNLNAGNYTRALELLQDVGQKGYKHAFVNYLLSIVYLKKQDIPLALEFLGKAVEEDGSFKIIAHNEPDFDLLFENEEFQAIVQL